MRRRSREQLTQSVLVDGQPQVPAELSGGSSASGAQCASAVSDAHSSTVPTSSSAVSPSIVCLPGTQTLEPEGLFSEPVVSISICLSGPKFDIHCFKSVLYVLSSQYILSIQKVNMQLH